jgi:5-methylcytosine-specific restriction enzyme A
MRAPANRKPRLRLRRIGPPSIRRINLSARVQQIGAAEAERARAARRSAKPTFAFYGSAEWKALMRRVIAARGRRCQDSHCKTPNRGQGQRIYGDHVVELSDGGGPLDEGNVLLRLASPCRVGAGGESKLRARAHQPAHGTVAHTAAN